MATSNIGSHVLGFAIGTVLGTVVYAYRNPEHWARETGLHIRWQRMRRTPVNWDTPRVAQVPQAQPAPERWTDPGQSS